MKQYLLVNIFFLLVIFATSCNNKLDKNGEQTKVLEKQELAVGTPANEEEFKDLSEEEKKITTEVCDCAEEFLEFMKKKDRGEEIDDDEALGVNSRMEECHNELRKKHASLGEEKGEEGIRRYTKRVCPEFYQLMLKAGTVQE